MISPQVIQELLTVRQVLHYLPASPKTENGWTAREQQLFWDALTQFPQGPWTTIAEYIGTKTTRQAMTHGQKLRQKLNRWRKRLRRTPAAAAALAANPRLLDDDVRASMMLSSAMMSSSSALPASSSMMMMMAMASPTATSVASSLTTAAPTLSVRTVSAPTATAPARSFSSHLGLYVDDVPTLPQYTTRSHSRQTMHSLSYDLAAASSRLAADDTDYSELLMSSFSTAPVGLRPFTEVSYSTATALGVDGLERIESLPPSLASSERLARQYRQRHTSQPAHRRSTSRPEGVDTGASEPPVFYSNDERYAIPPAMADDLADVLWDYEL